MKDKNKPILVVLSGAGISAESGLKTFRDSDGLWEGFKIEEVATPEAWNTNPKKVLDFYNERRKAANEAFPNQAHLKLNSLEKYFDVVIITQNVDNLHERAGSSKILHLHGELNKSRSTVDINLIYPILGDNLNYGETCELGSQLRPHIVWFGELVPNIEIASELVSKADYFLIIGTSLQVYPAAGLVRYCPIDKPIFIIDPKPMGSIGNKNLVQIKETAVNGMVKFEQLLMDYLF
jgi:NAD-dependent deacetylase